MRFFLLISYFPTLLLCFPLFEKLCDTIGEKFAETTAVQFLAAAIPITGIAAITGYEIKKNKKNETHAVENDTNEPTVPDNWSNKLKKAHPDIPHSRE